MIQEFLEHVENRKAEGVPPLALTAVQAEGLVELLQDPPQEHRELLVDLLENRIAPGVDPAAKVKASFLGGLARRDLSSPLVSPGRAVELLGTMLGGYNVPFLLALLDDETMGAAAAEALSKTLFAFDAVDQVRDLAVGGNTHARRVLESWAAAEWFTRRSEVPSEIRVCVYKVDGEVNTDDFSPAKNATTRPDIPLHAQVMGGARFPDGIQKISELKQSGLPVAFVGDVVGTGSSRKSACNSLLWHIGEDIPFVPNKRAGGVILGGVIAPIFFNTAEDSGALPIQCDVTGMETGQVLTIRPSEGRIFDEDGSVVCTFELEPSTMLDEYRAGGRVPLIIGKDLTQRARKALGLGPIDLFAVPPVVVKEGVGFTLAQKIVGRASGTDGIHPGTACLPKMTSVGSQDTTGPMTADEIKELACLGFQSDLFMQSFCHTAAYPREVDSKMHETLPVFMQERQGISLRPGDGVIHSWINRMILPDTVGTGGDSHTRFPLGISFPAGSGLVAFAGALGMMPLQMPESVLVRFSGELRPGITLRDVVNAIPWKAIQMGLMTVEKKGKINAFNGRILEMEGLPDLKVEQAFELTDATAERSAAAGTIDLSEATVAEYLRSNVALLRSMIRDGYGDSNTLERRIEAMEAWLADPSLLRRDADAEFAETIELDLAEIDEPIVACPNDPDDVKKVSEVSGTAIDEVFIGSCMTNIGHFRAAARVLEGRHLAVNRLWIATPTRMDKEQLEAEGVMDILRDAGARIEIPGCSLCMGNQARVEDKATVFSTSTRNFDNRLGDGAQVFLGSAEMAAVCALLGRIPIPEEYFEMVEDRIAGHEADIYRYLNFDQMESYS
ncbi:MAG: bifunctional aconitate hydratase 2/2-methylisocitrate dehydratase [Thermoanaerobaculales bacterium]|nr:bifunctional aconitate hydratase 2/2-methylisocitrate dehydratase [Thermoanaerobaculales bacterium]